MAIVLCMILFSCARDKKEAPTEAILAQAEPVGDCPKYLLDNKENNLNLSIFLDLSDRITAPKAVQKDVEYLKSIAQSFTNHVKTKKLILLNDQIQLYFNPEPTNEGINQLKMLGQHQNRFCRSVSLRVRRYLAVTLCIQLILLKPKPNTVE